MSPSLSFPRRLPALLLLIGIGLTGCAGITATPPPAMQQQIEAARTPADHLALANYFTQEAAGARKKAAEHRQLGKIYQAAPLGNRGGSSMVAHCNATASSFEEIAARFDLMAEAHRQMAAPPKP